ncbi:MAG: RNA 2',3'-cyclic phosphodiesterase [Hyphomicrobiales bacterium]
MPRLFTGLEIPGDVALRLSLLRGGLANARWVDEANYHITLRFIGDIDDRTADAIVAELDGIIRHLPFEVTLTGLDAFGGGRPRAVFARVEPSRPLVDLAADHERAMQRVGLAPESRKFTPHVTLARLRGPSSTSVAGFLASRGGAFSPMSFEARRFVLYSSRASTGGGPYIVEQAWPL